MSVTFTQISIADSGRAHGVFAHDVFKRVANELSAIGMAPRGAVRRFTLDAAEGEYSDGASLGVSALEYLSAKPGAHKTDGVSAQFGNENMEATIRLALQESGAIICFTDMPDRMLYGCFKDGKEAYIHRLMVACARGCECRISFGAMELEWRPYSEDEIARAIVDGPEGYEGKPPPFCLLNRNDHAVPGIKDIDPRFDATTVSGYWVLQRRGLNGLYASLPR